MQKPESIPPSDERLMQQVQNGDQRAFRKLYQRYHRKVFGYFYRMLNRDRDLASDMLQEVFVKVVEKANGYDPDKSFKTWLFSMASNLCKNQYRKWDNRDKAFAAWAEQNGVLIAADMPLKMDLEKFGEALDKALETLDEKKKTAFILRFKEDFSLEEIAAVQDCPVGTVKSRLYYTLRLLQEQLAEFNPETI